MVESDRRPSAQEIEELEDLVRRDPASPAFIDLGDAYLALGRPQDALRVGATGLSADPNSSEGRVMLARAHCALHQWKEAQGELLRVVKVDRNSRGGFALLGEVLLRRSDYERALPVLQHAQNLDPTSSTVLTLLRRARAGQQLDPPPPIPSPISPRQDARARPPAPAPAPTRTAAPAPPRQSMRAAAQPAPIDADPTAVNPFDDHAGPGPAMLASSPAAAPARPPARAPAPAPARSKPASLAPPLAPSGEVVRPRVVSNTREKNAAAPSLRRSAAVGENYLNDLLTGGLLDIGGVRVPELDYDLKPDRRWGRSTTRMFIFLFVLLFLGVGGGGGYWWYSNKVKAEKVARLQKSAKEKIVTASWVGLDGALQDLKVAIQTDKRSALTYAYVCETAGLRALLYGTDPDTVDTACKQAARDIKKPTQKGYHEIAIGRSAIELARLPTREAPTTALAEVVTALDALLTADDGDQWARWLKARAQLAAGERKAAHASLKQAGAAATDGGSGLLVAVIDRADLLVDEGQLGEAIKLYDEVLAAEKDHPLALLGRALGRAESGVDTTAAVDDLSAKLDKPLGPRVAAYRNLALALAQNTTEDYAEFLKSMAAASAPAERGDLPESRFMARLAMAQYLRGRLEASAKARATIKSFKDAEPDPLVLLVEAGLNLAGGVPDKAVDIASKVEGVRARLIRVQGLIDAGKARDAQAEADELITRAPENLEAQVMREWAAVLAASSGKDRDSAFAALEKVARRTKSKLGQHALGAALVATGGDPAEARKKLAQAIDGISDDAPNPVEYRTHTTLAQLMITAGELEPAAAELDKAVAANPGFLPARGLQGKLAMAKGDAAGALELFGLLERDKAPMVPLVELAYAEAMVSVKGAKDADRTAATEIIKRLQASASATSSPSLAELSRVAALIDEQLPAALGLPKADGAAPEPAPRRGRRR